MAGFLTNRMRSASILWYPSFCTDASTRIINTSTANIKIIDISLFFISISDCTF